MRRRVIAAGVGNDRERVDGTQITIGRRVLTHGGAEKASRKYVAEYRDATGKQMCESLHATNRAVARRRAIELQQRLERGESRPVRTTLTIDELIGRYHEYVKLRQSAPKTIAKYVADLDKLKVFATG